MNRTYRLYARVPGRTESIPVEAENDLEAGMDAIARILELAVRGNKEDKTSIAYAWAKGRITLEDPEGNILHEMPSKVQS